MSEMEHSRLIQRLKAPRERENPFAFGGGLQNGGLSDAAMSLLRSVFSFDYMGAAEFEWGAVPKALRHVATAKDLVAFDLTIPRGEIADGWRGERAESGAVVYVLCPEAMRDEVCKRVRLFANGVEDDLKERTRLADALREPADAFTPIGWLELDNGFLFFVDHVMWEKTSALFGVETFSEVTQ